MKTITGILINLLVPLFSFAQWIQVAQIGNINQPYPEIATDCYMISPTRGVALMYINMGTPHASRVQAWFTNSCWSAHSVLFDQGCQTGGGGSLYLQGLDFINDTVGFFIEASWFDCNSYRTFKTTNGGQSFSTFSLPNGLNALALDFLDEDHGYLMAFTGSLTTHFYLLRYNNGTYTTVHDYGIREYGPYGPYFMNDSIGFVSYDNHLYRTSDYGQTWTEPEGVTGTIYRFNFTSDSIGYLVKNNADFYKTTDGGQHWSSLPAPPSGNRINSMFFFNDSVGYATGNAGTILYTINGGQSWDIQESPTSANLGRIRFVTPEMGFIFAAGGALLQMLIVGKEEIEKPDPVTVYPNPSGGKFILELPSVSQAKDVLIDVYGMHGEKVFPPIITRERKYELSLSGQPEGIYFIRITSDDKIETLKIIKVH